MARFPNPCASDLSISVREGCHRTIGHKVINKEEPITSNILMAIYDLYGSESSSLLGIRICCMCLLSYAGFLRFSKLVQLKRSDLCFFDNYMTLFIPKSKTDRYREGSNVIISCSNEITCPVKMTRRYLTLAKTNDQSDIFI